MNVDLISRKAALGIITPRLNSSKIGSLESQRLYSISEEIKHIPTAFDVEKVITELEELRDFKANNFNISKYGLMQMVIEVVKSALNQ